MNDEPRQTLRELIARHGPGLCSDARRCEGLLRDLCGEHRREINLLIGALRERVPLDLLAAQGSMPRGLLLARLSRRLEDQLAVTEPAARWAVDSWALALGVVTDAELKEMEKETARANTQPATPAQPAAQDDARNRSPRQQQTTPAPQTRQQQPRTPSPQPQTPSQAPNRQTRGGRTPAPPAPARPPKAAGRNPFWWPLPNPPAKAQPDPAFPQDTAQDARPRGLLWSLRGCNIGCLLLLLLAFALFAGVPYIFSVLREGQQ